MDKLIYKSSRDDGSLKETKSHLSNSKFSFYKGAFGKEYSSINKVDLIAVYTKGKDMKYPSQKFTYQELINAITGVASKMYSHGLRKGDKVLFISRNSFEFAVTFWAVHRVGAVSAIIPPWHPKISYVLRYTNCKALIVDQEVYTGVGDKSPITHEIDKSTNIRLVMMTNFNPDEGDLIEEDWVEYAGSNTVQEYYPDQHPENENTRYKLIKYDPKINSYHPNKEDIYIKEYKNFESLIDEELDKIRNTDDCLFYYSYARTGSLKGCIHNQMSYSFGALTYGRQCVGYTPGSITACTASMMTPYGAGSNLIFPFYNGGSIFLDNLDLYDTELPLVHKILVDSELDINILISKVDRIGELIKFLNTNDSALIGKMIKLNVVTAIGTDLVFSTYKNFKFFAKKYGLPTKMLVGRGSEEVHHIFVSNHTDKIYSEEAGIGELVSGYESILVDPKEVDIKGDIQKIGGFAVRSFLPGICSKYSYEYAPGLEDSIKKDIKDVRLKLPGSSNHPFYITDDIVRVDSKDVFYLVGKIAYSTCYDSLYFEAFDYMVRIINKLGLYESMGSELYQILDITSERIIEETLLVPTNKNNICILSVRDEVCKTINSSEAYNELYNYISDYVEHQLKIVLLPSSYVNKHFKTAPPFTNVILKYMEDWILKNFEHIVI